MGNIALTFSQGPEKQYLLESVLHVAEFGTNSLLRVIWLTNDQKLKVEFEHDNVTFRANGTTVGEGTVVNKLFYFKVASGVVNSYHSTYITKDHYDTILWYNRRGHLSLRTVKRLAGSVLGRKVAGSMLDSCLCGACILGMLCRQQFLTIDMRK